MSDREGLAKLLEETVPGVEYEGPPAYLKFADAFLESDWLDRKLNDAYNAGFDKGWVARDTGIVIGDGLSEDVFERTYGSA